MNETPKSSLEVWKARWSKLRAWGKRILPFVFTAAATFLLFLLYNTIALKPEQMTPREVNDAVAQAMASATAPPAYSAQVYQVIQPSLVLIQTTGPNGAEEHDFGLGSGVVVDQAGNILTSLHVVADAREIRVTFADGTQTNAQIVNEQPEKDIAVLQANQLPAILVPAVLGSSASMRVGDEAFVVGNPFGLYSSMSAGVISGFDRSFQPPGGNMQLEGMIQVDAAINPGNSGGPLLNRSGHVIGVVTGIVNPTQENFFVGIGFAVPIEVALGGMGTPPY